MKKIILFTIIPFIFISTFAQNKRAYHIYNANGKKVKYHQMMKRLKKADIILFGEQHNNPIAHWLQYEISSDLSEKSGLIYGAEMFEADNQDELNLYLNDSIDYKGLDSLARLWPNYKTDYKPLVDLAKEQKVAFIATNVPREYASLVYKKGFEALDTLPEKEKAWIAPLPIEYDPELPGYKNMLSMQSHGGENLPKAQALKDATMAYFISENYEPGKIFIHFNGAYHSDNYEGILWYLKQQLSQLNYVTLSTVLQNDITSLGKENKGIADYIICVDEDMTKTY